MITGYEILPILSCHEKPHRQKIGGCMLPSRVHSRSLWNDFCVFAHKPFGLPADKIIIQGAQNYPWRLRM